MLASALADEGLAFCGHKNGKKMCGKKIGEEGESQKALDKKIGDKKMKYKRGKIVT